MNKTQYTGVQALPLSDERGFPSSRIYFIPQQRVMHMGHMNTDLMSPPCLEPAFHIGVLSEPFKDSAVCHCSLAVASHSHFSQSFSFGLSDLFLWERLL